MPVTVTAGELRRRLEAERRQGAAWGWLGAIAAATAIAVVAVSAWSSSPRPPTSGATATPGVQCAESPATTHGGWWVEVGGPNAFFNIEPGTRTPTDDGATWLLHVRFDPDAGPDELVSIAADLAEGRHVDGRLNSRPTPPTSSISSHLLRHCLAAGTCSSSTSTRRAAGSSRLASASGWSARRPSSWHLRFPRPPRRLRHHSGRPRLRPLRHPHRQSVWSESTSSGLRRTADPKAAAATSSSSWVRVAKIA